MLTTIHTARTLMATELGQLLNHVGSAQTYDLAIDENVTGKRTQANRNRTHASLKRLYTLKPAYAPFAALRYFWPLTDPHQQPLLAFLYALEHDYLLADSFPVVCQTFVGSPVTVGQLREHLDRLYPERFTTVTQHSIAKNLASSFKQAGYLRGKINPVRIAIQPTVPVVTFAFLLAYLQGVRGEFLLQSRPVLALQQDAESVHQSLIQASQRGWLTYHRAGAVLSISFDALISQIIPTNGH